MERLCFYIALMLLFISCGEDDVVPDVPDVPKEIENDSTFYASAFYRLNPNDTAFLPDIGASLFIYYDLDLDKVNGYGDTVEADGKFTCYDIRTKKEMTVYPDSVVSIDEKNKILITLPPEYRGKYHSIIEYSFKCQQFLYFSDFHVASTRFFCTKDK